MSQFYRVILKLAILNLCATVLHQPDILHSTAHRSVEFDDQIY